MAENYCEVCDTRFKEGEKKELVRVHGGYGYAHTACLNADTIVPRPSAEIDDALGTWKNRPTGAQDATDQEDNSPDADSRH